MEIPHYANRIKSAREQTGKSREEMAALLNIAFASYRDLEFHDDEILTCLSLREVEKLCEVLNITSVDLLSDQRHLNEQKRQITLQELLDRVRKYIQEHNLTIESFEDQTGWEINAALENAELALKWNVDCLKDICEQINVNWLEIFPISKCV